MKNFFANPFCAQSSTTPFPLTVLLPSLAGPAAAVRPAGGGASVGARAGLLVLVVVDAVRGAGGAAQQGHTRTQGFRSILGSVCFKRAAVIFTSKDLKCWDLRVYYFFRHDLWWI